MDAETVDQQYADLQQKGQQTATLVQALAGKLAAAATAGDTNAREWQLDLKEIALAIRDEESTATSLLQAIHALVDNHVQAQSAPAAPSPPAYQPPPYQPAYQPAPYEPPYQGLYQAPSYSQPGGGLHRFLGSSFGRAIVTGAGFGIGDDLINSVFR
ncbi:MAG: hypothetical protein JO280_13470 [Mycobacteriaceae bacterium]|nr:hypothetical protein [Mycobacteriaceae bacterium]